MINSDKYFSFGINYCRKKFYFADPGRLLNLSSRSFIIGLRDVHTSGLKNAYLAHLPVLSSRLDAVKLFEACFYTWAGGNVIKLFTGVSYKFS